MEIFYELSLIFILAAVVSLLMRAIKQPLIVGYIITGLLSGPYALGILNSVETIELFSKIGITVLLFIVGLNLSPKVIREVGKISLATGIGQVLFTATIGFGIALFLGIDRIAAMYVAIALTFSSTIIVLKLLSDKGELNALYGKIAVGFLLVQDIIATFILLMVSSFRGDSGENIAVLLLLTLAKGVLLIGGILIASSFFLPYLVQKVAKSQELLFLCALAWGMALAALCAWLGFSVEIGALVAGVTLSSTPFAYEIGARIRPLRDFFIILFFILLGSQMELGNIQNLIFPALVLSVFVLIGNPLIVIVIMNLLGYHKKTGFQAGLTVAQISEFSLILAALGFEIGHVDRETLSLITIVGLITIAGSTYLILYDKQIYPRVEKFLTKLELRKTKTTKSKEDKPPEALLFGFHRVGEEFLEVFKEHQMTYLVVDFNPQSIQKLSEENIPFRFGDAGDVEFLDELGVKKVKCIVSTIPDFDTNMLLTQFVARKNPKALIIVLSHYIDQAIELYRAGATYVIMPHYLGARHAAKMITHHQLNKISFKEEKERHLKYLVRHFESGRI